MGTRSLVVRRLAGGLPGVCVVVMLSVVVMPMVVTACRGRREFSPQKGGDQRLHAPAKGSGPHLDAVAREILQRPVADATSDDHFDPVLPEPAREQAGLVVRCGVDFGSQRRLQAGVDLDDRELTAAAEVSVQMTGLDG